MKSTEANLENVEFHNVRKMPKEESLKRARRISGQNPHPEDSTIWTRRWQLAGFLAAGYFTFTPLAVAHGHSGGHMSGMGNSGNAQHNDHSRYFNLFTVPRTIITLVFTTRSIRIRPPRNSRLRRSNKSRAIYSELSRASTILLSIAIFPSKLSGRRKSRLKTLSGNSHQRATWNRGSCVV
jgi:hypothetical protein